jgi:hypothetical protein
MADAPLPPFPSPAQYQCVSESGVVDDSASLQPNVQAHSPDIRCGYGDASRAYCSPASGWC